MTDPTKLKRAGVTETEPSIFGPQPTSFSRDAMQVRIRCACK